MSRGEEWSGIYVYKDLTPTRGGDKGDIQVWTKPQVKTMSKEESPAGP